MVAQRVGLVELFVALGTRVVVERDVLGHAGSALELCIAAGAGVRHYVNNSGSDTLKELLKIGPVKLLRSINLLTMITNDLPDHSTWYISE
nr:hypothetical protein [Halonotius pteroides]